MYFGCRENPTQRDRIRKECNSIEGQTADQFSWVYISNLVRSLSGVVYIFVFFSRVLQSCDPQVYFQILKADSFSMKSREKENIFHSSSSNRMSCTLNWWPSHEQSLWFGKCPALIYLDHCLSLILVTEVWVWADYYCRLTQRKAHPCKCQWDQ